MKKKLPWDLIISKLRQELSPEGEILFEKWLNEENHSQLFRQLELVWNNIQNKVSVYEPDMEYYWKELSARIESAPSETEAPKERRFSLKSINRRLSRIAAVATILLMSTFFCAYYLGKYNSDRSQAYITYSTLNSKSKVFLPDSSEVWLHNNSSLTYNFNRKSGQREVTLVGEAFFRVKHDAEKSFIVASNGVDIKVHGTQFNVSSYPSAEKVLVSLYEGSVSMNTTDKNVFLTPGEEGLFDVKSKELSVKEGDVEFAKVWTSDKIRFEDKNLREVCKYLSKWYGVEFSIDPDISNDQSFTFTFRGQSLDDVVGIMTSIQSFNYDINEEEKIVLIQK